MVLRWRVGDSTNTGVLVICVLATVGGWVCWRLYHDGCVCSRRSRIFLKRGPLLCEIWGRGQLGPTGW